MTEVSLTKLTKTYPGAPRPAVDRLTLPLTCGKLTALLGPSGCGKTTVMRMIAGLLQPSSGDISFDGRSILGERPEDRRAVMVFQNHMLFPFMTVAENIGFGLKMRHLPAAEIATRVDEMLERVRLPGMGARRPAALSGGQQQRVALARALILQPKVLLLDEPLSNLDAHLRLEMRDLIRGLQQDMAITTLLVTHDQEEAVVLADHVALMLNGQLRQTGAAQSFYRRPADAEVAHFFGGRNFIAGQSRGGVFTSALGALRLPDGAPEGPGLLTFRPEAVEIGAEPENSLTATLTDCQFLGSEIRLLLQSGGLALEALTRPRDAEGLAPGKEIAITLPRETLWVIPKTPG
ncbi:MAG: ABC transporter ATP-binding protein [Tabrizicola sp.]|nr:ABC transporter ATP-binding protein [Tabrizicola sp.]